MPLVLFALTDGERVCPFRALVVLYRMLPIFTDYEISNVWATVSTIVLRPRMFPPTDLLYIKFTCYTQDNHQGCFRLSFWFSLRCLGPPVWWSGFSFMFLNEHWCVSLTQWRGIFYWCLVFIVVSMHCPHVTFIIRPIWFHSEIAVLF